MNSFQAYLENLGGMHDSIAVRLEVDGQSAKLTIEVQDLYSNFDGLPEYRGVTPATIVFEGIERCSIGLQLSIRSQAQELHIDDFVVLEKTAWGEKAQITFWPEGIIKIEYAKVSVESAGNILWPREE